MTANLLETTLDKLSDIQREAVEWDDGPMLVLAGPGSGKTRVLTCRVARILNRSPDERFRVLALTFTNKAAREMESRVTDLVPNIAERADIDTFHGFCAQALRQHGAHLNIKPDFAIYSQTSDRQAVLEDAIRRDTGNSSHLNSRVLPLIDVMKSRLVSPEQSESWLAGGTEGNVVNPEIARRTAQAYLLYEDELRRANVLDLNSLICETYKLFQYPGLVRHYQTVYRYWLFDEFQDTNYAQYKLLRRMAGEDFRQVFAVADDDQTIYEWNGADTRRISTLAKDFSCEVIQLPTNFRCPPQIVEAANRLIVYNTRRRGLKRPSKPAPQHPSEHGQQIRCRVFETDEEEATGIAAEIARQDVASRSRTLVLARTRALLESMSEALKAENVPTQILLRRDDFASPQMRWLVACLKQIHRPLNQHNLAVLLETFDRFATQPLKLDHDELISRSVAAEGAAYLTMWIDAAQAAELQRHDIEIVEAISDLASGRTTLDAAVKQILAVFETTDSANGDQDIKDDLSAWRRLSSEIRSSLRHAPAPLDRFLQELELRSKEPIPLPGAVSLATIHCAKGLEADTVYLIGLAEDVLPSWHSINKGNGGVALEEERRSCFVAITRAKKQLILSRAHHYRGWPKQQSRFLQEMLPQETFPIDNDTSR